MNLKAFADYNAQLAAAGQPPLANPRNAAAGTLRMKDPNEVGKRRLEAFLYHVSYIVPLEVAEQLPLPQTHHAMLQMLWEAGFRSPIPEAATFADVSGVIDYCNRYELERDNLPYEIDGMVIKVNDLALHDLVGMTSHHPRWAIAYKFKARQATSVLRQVEFQVGRTGAVTPVAKIDAVSIGGVTVTSISVHNEEYIREKDLRIGDTIIIERAGDVIPQIVRSVPEARTGSETPIVFPTHCPVCGSLLFKEPGEAVWRCINAECKAQVVERMIHFVSKDAMDIRSFGEQQVRRFYDAGLIHDIPSIYRIDFERIAKFDGFGKKSIDNLKQAIEASRSQPLYRLIYGLGIRHVGETTAKALAQRVNHLLELKELSVDDLMQMDDIGPKVAGSIYNFFTNKQNLEMLQLLEELGLTLHRSNNDSLQKGGLAGQTFLFTGTLLQLKRSDAEASVEKAGGTILSGVSSKLNYLVVGEDAGSKLEKARKIPSIRIVSEQEFLNLIAYDTEN
jgi:DNA ligase (NAD+)